MIYINLTWPLAVPEKATRSSNGIEYSAKFGVISDGGRAGSLILGRDEDGEGFVEWCKGNCVEGFGVQVGLDYLIEWIESQALQD